MKNLFIIDGMALAYRGHFAFIRNPLRNSRGAPTSAVYSFLSTVLKIVKDEKADQIAVVFDSDKETFRHKMYPEYKAHRPPMPEDLREQIPVILDLLKAMNLPVLRLPGIEADDIIATLAVKTAEKGGKAFIISKDKDFGQIVSDRIVLVDPKFQGNELMHVGIKEIREKFGVPPEKMIDYQSLIGDASDNIPGVDKVGPKTAAELIKTYGGLDEIYASIEKITQKGLKANLIACREKAYLSRTLVTLKTDIAVPQEEFPYGPVENEGYVAMLKNLEFGQFLKGVAAAPADREEKPDHYELITDMKGLKAFLEKGEKAPCLAVDTETDGLSARTAGLVGLSLSFEPHCACYIPLNHQTGRNLDVKSVAAAMAGVFKDPAVTKAGHNLKFDLAVLKSHGMEVEGPLFDTMVAAYLLNPGTRQYGLEAASLEALGEVKRPITELIGEKGKDQKIFSEVPPEAACAYSARDADLTFRLKGELEKRLEEKGQSRLFRDMEMPVLRTLLEMEETGVRIDADFLKGLSGDYDRELENLHKEIVREAGHEFNLNSPKQLAEVLFNEKKIKPLRKLKTGYSTDADVLEALAREHVLPRLLLRHRELMKLKNTYVDVLPQAVDAQGLVHTSFNQTVTATGRLSSSDPNLQNVPVRTAEGKEIRKAFVPRKKGAVIISADYSQIELRVLAHVSGEKALIEAFRLDKDIHTQTAALIFGMMPEMVAPEQRAMAKTVNFGIIYGQGAFGLSQQLGIPQGEARAFIDGYFATYPGIRGCMDRSIAFAREHGYVETLYGRRRFLPEINGENHNLRAFAERTAINTPIQGTAADLIKIAMVRVREKIRAGKIKALLLLQVHDELVFEAGRDGAEEAMALIRGEMESAAELAVPLKVDIGTGDNWLEAH